MLVFSSALTLGVAALVAIGSVGWNLQRAIHDQARTLVGADVIVEARAPLDAAATRFVDSLGASEKAGETRLASMTQFPGGGARLTQVRGMEGGYPFYGAIETDPAAAANAFRAGKGALLEETLMTQYGVKPGDVITVGGAPFPVLGSVTKLPGEANAFASIAPRVLIPRAQMPAPLLSRGSVVRFFSYLKLPPGTDVEKLLEKHRKPDEFKKYQLETDTVAHRERQLGRVFLDVNRFLKPGELHRAAAGRDRRGERDPRAPENQAADRGRAAVPGGVVVADAGDLPDPGARAGVGGCVVGSAGRHPVTERRASVPAERAADQPVVCDLVGGGGRGRGRGLSDVRAVRAAAAAAGPADATLAGAALGVRE